MGALSLVGTFSVLGGQTRYIYDELGRLHAEVDDQGNVAIYDYDAVGNLLSITRRDATQTGVSITFFSPEKGPEETEVTIFGAGFSPTPTDNQVTFNGTAAQVLSSTPTEIVTRVPSGATTGPIAVNNPGGSATSTTPFTVTAPIGVGIDPATAIVIAGASRQFTATVTGATNQDVIWELDGIGTLTGSISETGLYSVPSDFIGTAQVIIKARSVIDQTRSGTATVFVLPSTPLGPVVSPQVSVTIVQTPSTTGPFIAPQVSVDVQQPEVQSGPFVAPQVAVEIEPARVTSGPFVGPHVSVALTPIISGISPSSGAQGATNLSVTFTGSGLAGATAISFLLNGAIDNSLTAVNVSANAQGTQVTADLAIGAAAPTGLRVVRITTPSGISPAAATGGNVFTVLGP